VYVNGFLPSYMTVDIKLICFALSVDGGAYFIDLRDESHQSDPKPVYPQYPDYPEPLYRAGIPSGALAVQSPVKIREVTAIFWG
jgi:hypothetical protein